MPTYVTPILAYNMRTGKQHLAAGIALFGDGPSGAGSYASGGADMSPMINEQPPTGVGYLPTFERDPDARLHWRHGYGDIPDPYLDPEDPKVRSGGFKIPLSVTRFFVREMHAGKKWFRLKVYVYPYATAGAIVLQGGVPSGGNQTPTDQNHHGGDDKGTHRERFNSTDTPIGSGRFQTNIMVSNSGTAATTVVDHTLTRDDIGMADGAMVVYFGELTPSDPSVGGSPNLAVSIRSEDAAGAEVLPLARQVHHTVAPSPVYPLFGEDDITEDCYCTFGISELGAYGVMGELRAVIMGTIEDDGEGALLDDLGEIEGIIDALLADIVPPPDTLDALALHAWTAEPLTAAQVDDGLTIFRDVAAPPNGGMTLNQLGSGTSPTAGVAAIPGLPDRVRGFVIGSSSAKALQCPAEFTDLVEADLAAGKTSVLHLAMTRPAPLTGAVRGWWELGSSTVVSIFGLRQDSSDNLIFRIVQAGAFVNLRVGGPTTTLNDIWPSQAGTLLVSAQITNAADAHAAETYKQMVVVDTLHLDTMTRTRVELYPAGSAATGAMQITSTVQSSIGASVSGSNTFGGTIACAYMNTDAVGEVWDQVRALDELENFGAWDGLLTLGVAGTAGHHYYY